MADEILVDTNVLVYAYDRAEPRKQKRALDTLRRLAVGGRGRLSAQILGEFFRAVTRKIPSPLSPSDAYGQIATLIRALPALPVSPAPAADGSSHSASRLEGQRDFVQNGIRYLPARQFLGALV